MIERLLPIPKLAIEPAVSAVDHLFEPSPKELLDALLDISRLDAEVVEPTIDDFPLSLLFDRIEAAYGKVAGAKEVEFSIHHHGLAVRTDRTLLGRIVGNLIENAIQYTWTGAVRVECRSLGDRVRMQVHATDFVSTAAVLSAEELSDLAAVIAEYRIPVIFQDNQANPQAITSLQEAVRALDFETTISDTELYADSLGAEPGVDTYLGVFRHNARAVAAALGKGAA